MRILICYPPLSCKKGHPTLGQNRQFQYFKEPLDIYPVVPAQAATLLQKAGYQVIWKDCIAQNWPYQKFLAFLQKEKPDLIAFETKTPVIKQHWKIIDDIKGLFPPGPNETISQERVPKIALFGDHVTALPEESFKNSKVDFVLTGGDYDFLLLNLCNYLQDTKDELEPGIYYRENSQIKNTGRFQLNHSLDSLPFIDRDLTDWRAYGYNNGNYKRIPGTYIMSGRDCWWNKCLFCSWPQMYPHFRLRSVDKVLEEIGLVIDRYKVREIMDDTGCFPVGEWLRHFCSGVIKQRFHKKIYLDCNMRFAALGEEDFRLMKRANFRLLLFGLESASQDTLDRLQKNLRVERVIEDCKIASRCGLSVHITIMFGYPWETYTDAVKTLKLGKWLLSKGYAYTMQATVVIPYPGTPLFAECKQNNLLATLDWDDYDMKQPVMKTGVPKEEIIRFVQKMYRVSFHPQFLLRKLFAISDADDLRYFLRAIKKVRGHIFDFRKL
jgi:radical SAM superfamily enzyme YgiQ (UPF0313 family)